MVTRIMSVSDLIPEAKQAFMDGKFRFGTAYEIAKLPADQQSAKLALVLSRQPRSHRETLPETGRRNARSDKSRARIAIELPGGVSVVLLTGKVPSLDEAIDKLSQVVSAAKHARDENLTLTSWSAAMKESAKTA